MKGIPYALKTYLFFCTHTVSGHMELSLIEPSGTFPPQIVTSNHLMDGLEMNSGNRFVDASFLKLFHKLIQFDYLYFSCFSVSGGHYGANNIYGIEEGTAVRKYFSNELQNRPSCNSSLTTTECSSFKDRLFSSNDVTDGNERPYKDIFILEGGGKFSMSEPNCFGGEHDYIVLDLEIS